MIFRVVKQCKCLEHVFNIGHEFAEGDLPREVADMLIAAGDAEVIGVRDEGEVAAANGKKPHRFATLSPKLRAIHGL